MQPAPQVFVVDLTGKPCLPTRPARARILIRNGKAKVIQVVPYTIQLKREVENPVGSFEVGIDDGAKFVGVSVVNDQTKEVVFYGEIKLRQDVSLKMEQRKTYRRSRRTRNLGYRQPRFSNRISSFLAPSIRCRKDSILRFIKDMMKRINITKVTVEEVTFNQNKSLRGKWFSLVETGKIYLREQILKLGLIFKYVHGYMTKEWRLNLGLSKTHGNDAIAIACRENKPTISSLYFTILPRRTKPAHDKTCTEKNGFRHYDLVKAERAGETVIGSIKALKKGRIVLRTEKDNNYTVQYSKTRLLQRFEGLAYAY